MVCNRAKIGKAKDTEQIYDVKVIAMTDKQDTKYVIKYANHLKALWRDHYRVIKAMCYEDSTILREYIE